VQRLNQASQLVAEALDADKVDAFLYDVTIDTLVAVGSSNRPMARLQQRLGLNRVPIANGGYDVEVFEQGISYRTGRAEHDPKVAVGLRQRLGAQSILAVPLRVGHERGGVLEVISAQPDKFSDDDLYFTEAVARWVRRD